MCSRLCPAVVGRLTWYIHALTPSTSVMAASWAQLCRPHARTIMEGGTTPQVAHRTFSSAICTTHSTSSRCRMKPASPHTASAASSAASPASDACVPRLLPRLAAAATLNGCCSCCCCCCALRMHCSRLCVRRRNSPTAIDGLTCRKNTAVTLQTSLALQPPSHAAAAAAWCLAMLSLPAGCCCCVETGVCSLPPAANQQPPPINTLYIAVHTSRVALLQKVAAMKRFSSNRSAKPHSSCRSEAPAGCAWPGSVAASDSRDVQLSRTSLLLDRCLSRLACSPARHLLCPNCPSQAPPPRSYCGSCCCCCCCQLCHRCWLPLLLLLLLSLWWLLLLHPPGTSWSGPSHELQGAAAGCTTQQPHQQAAV
ncbi:hypothetical protein COO60DRAFT_512952 [Scenedesmus sp. NREL 46B-D3]|nr:hypothetical protein COO60DRAFT_512952 [Scenedesmus sp. NREL 46B-D3]